eukprot:g7177.t1
MPREHRSTTKRKFQQWKKSRKGLIDKIGRDVLPDTAKIKEIFQEFDKDQSRGIDEAELKAGMLAMGIKLSDAETKQMLGDADEDDDGYIQLEEFETVVMDQVNKWVKANKSTMCNIL